MEINYNLTQKRKDTWRIALIPMPDHDGIEPGYRNQLEVLVSYDKSQRGAGRGYYLTVIGCTTDGVVEKHSLFADPHVQVLIRGAKRFSAKKLEELAREAPESFGAKIELEAEHAFDYYENKGEAA